MNYKKIYYSFIIFSLILSLALGSILIYFDNRELKIVFFDVGQGDAILIQKGSNQMLIDGGRNGKLLLEKLGEYIPFWDRKIELVMVSHPDLDHIGGLVEVVKSYQVDVVMKTNVRSESKADNAINEIIEIKDISIIETKDGVEVKIDDALGKIIYPFDSVTKNAETNENSVVFNLSVQDEDFLFVGDLPDAKELELVERIPELEAEVLKVSHHGSRFSSTDEFLSAVRPKTAVISVGKNSYGHPSPEALGRLRKIGANILRTDEKGDIMFRCTKVTEDDAECNIETER